MTREKLKPITRAVAVAVISISISVSVARADEIGRSLATSGAIWSQFRGPNSSGISEASVPIEFSPGKNELWNLPIGSGHSSPCVAGDAIYLTTYDAVEKMLAVVCIDRIAGKVRWTREVLADEIEKGHPSFNPASSSPASDGDRVVAYFGSYGMICFDRKGEKQWEVKMPVTKSYAGNATSPMIAGDRIILYRGNQVDHFLLAVDKITGEELWRVEQAERFEAELACTSCPIMGRDMLIIHSARSLQAFDVADGKQKWIAKCATTATSTPVIAGNEVIVAAWNKMGEPALRPAFPTFDELVEKHDQDEDSLINRNELPRMMIFHRPDGAEAPENGAPLSFGYADIDKNGDVDRNEWDRRMKELGKFRARYDAHGILAVPLDSNGVVPSEKVRTLETQGIPEVPSPLFHDGRLYFVKNGGVLTCLDVVTGKRIARLRTKGKGTHYASPIVAGGKLYSTAGDGTISVLSLSPKPKVIAINDMHDRTYATPAVADGTLYVRTHSKLYAFRAVN